MKFRTSSFVGAKASLLLLIVISLLSLSTTVYSTPEVPVEEQVCTEQDQGNCKAPQEPKDDVDQVEPILSDDDDKIAEDDEIKDTEYYDDDDFDEEAYDAYYKDINPEDYEFIEEGEGEEQPCKDNHQQCEEWANTGECDKNPKFMHSNCQKSCLTCPGHDEYGIEQNNEFMEGTEDFEKVQSILDKMKVYMEEEIRDKQELKYLLPKCKNRHSECAFWAFSGECEANPAYMLTNCAPVCKTCHMLDFKTRCPIKEGVVDAMKRGDVNRMFERIVEKKDFGNITATVREEDGIELDSSHLKVTVLSRPTYSNGDTKETADYQLGPWVITIDNFVHEKECDKLIQLGAVEGYERSEDVGKQLFDGSYDSVQSKSRTSHNAWCQNECYDDPMAKSVAARIEELTGIPEQNSENLQLLRYEVGQFYRTHHDYIDDQEDFPAGPRLLTAFLYLNDVEGGGGTNFPRLGITVMPKKGRLLLWPSVLDFNPLKIDSRTHHQALPVEKGVKYAANAWLHLRDFKEPNDRHCT